MVVKTLQEVFETSGQSGRSLLLAPYRDPVIVAYNRLEPRARTEDFTRSLRAEVRDPLWFLTRQWQMGEFEAEDAGSAVDVRLSTAQAQIDRVALQDSGIPYSLKIPLETMVEREVIPFTHALRVEVGQFFLKLHPLALRNKYAVKYRTAFPFPPNAEEEYRGQVDGLNLYLATRARDFDGEQLLRAIADGTLNTKAGIQAADQSDIEDLSN